MAVASKGMEPIANPGWWWLVQTRLVKSVSYVT